MRVRAVAVAVSVLLLGTRPAAGQRLLGVIRDSTTGLPLPGAVVSVVGANGGPASRTVASGDGRFALPVLPTGGLVEIRRIGYLPRNLPLPDSARGGDASIAVAMQRIPYTLDPVHVSSMACLAPAPSAGEALALWEQARTAFLATIVARDAAPAQMRVLNFNIEKSRSPAAAVVTSTTGVRPLMARTNDNVVSYGRSSEQRRVSTTPWVQWRSPWDAEVKGYVESHEGLVMYAPNTEVLLDPSFEAAHCFSIARADADHAGQIGVAFHPVEARSSMREIEGVLWMDRSPLAIRRLDYTYVGPGTFSIGQSGGWVRFRSAPNGIVLVDEWAIYYPGLWGKGWITTSANTTPPARPLEYLRLEIGGSTLLSAAWPDGTTIGAPAATVRGRVVEQNGGHPVTGAKVTLAVGTNRTVTGNDGMFTLSAPIPERYTVEVVDTSLARFGVFRTHAPVGANAEGIAGPILTITLEPMFNTARAQCQKNSLGGGKGVLLVRVADERDILRDSPVTLQWQGPKGNPIEKKWQTTRGWIPLCDVGAGTITMTADTRAGEGRAVFHASGAAVIDTVTIVLRERRPGGKRR